MEPNTVELQDAVVAAYLAGDRIADLEERFGVGRSTIYYLLKKSGKVPLRSQRRLGSDGTDVLIAGLRELIELQDRRIDELTTENDALKRAATVRSRSERRTG